MKKRTTRKKGNKKNGKDLSFPLDQLFLKTINNFKEEVRKSFERKALMPCLMLLYSFIDILSWLSYESESNQVGYRYEKFVENYLLPNSRLNCTPEDIYSARCGILHQYSSESDKVRAGKAKKILYVAYVEKKNEAEKHTITHKDENIVIIHIEDLIDAFEKSIEKLINSLKNDPHLADEVVERSRNWLVQFEK